MRAPFTYDDTELRASLRQYFDLKKIIEPDKEIRRRGKNIGMRLIREFKKAAPTKEEIQADAKRIDYRLKTRDSIKKKGGARQKQVKAELKARIAARTFSATGWFPAVEALGGSPKIAQRVKGPHRGKLEQRRGAASVQVTLTNDQPGAEQTATRKGNIMQKAVDDEVADMVKYIERKQAEAAQKAGL